MKVRPSSDSPAASLLIQGIPGSLRNKALVSRLYSDCGESVSRWDVTFFSFSFTLGDMFEYGNAGMCRIVIRGALHLTAKLNVQRNGSGIRGIGIGELEQINDVHPIDTSRIRD